MSKNNTIGAFFTPIEWAKWLINEYNIFDSWINGCTICDPTAGNGSFLEALIILAKENGVRVTSSLLERLYGIEKENRFILNFNERVQKIYGITFPKDNFINADIILSNPKVKTDILVGNPPWQNFSDLPDKYKEKIKPFYHEYKLISDSRKLLLGSSRADIASLILPITINDNLKKNGKAYFFIPLSLFLNEGAHSEFRKYNTKDICFAVNEIWDFGKSSIFREVQARYGAVYIQRDRATSYPVSYQIKSGSSWIKNYAMPLYSDNAPLSVFKDKKGISISSFHINADKESKPRQGVNTCGANNIFIFKNSARDKKDTIVIDNNDKKISLPGQFIFPLLSKNNFSEKCPIPARFILLPYDIDTGKPLNNVSIKKYPNLWKYLLKNKKILVNRKGVLINTYIKKNIWWALLGVGKYSFFPYKVAWESYGRNTFKPKILDSFKNKPWQAHQSLQAYMPFTSKKKAQKLLVQLKNPSIEKYLHSFRTEGTCNWAQPGKILRILEFKA